MIHFSNSTHSLDLEQFDFDRWSAQWFKIIKTNRAQMSDNKWQNKRIKISEPDKVKSNQLAAKLPNGTKETQDKQMDPCTDEKRLERCKELAIEEIYKDIAIKSVRAKEVGPSGWLDCPLRKTNKRFLKQTLRSALSHNKRTSDQEKHKSRIKSIELSTKKQPSKFGERKHMFKLPKREESEELRK